MNKQIKRQTDLVQIKLLFWGGGGGVDRERARIARMKERRCLRERKKRERMDRQRGRWSKREKEDGQRERSKMDRGRERKKK